ncbi:MAG: hypothetical protein DRH37_08665 [Deltaproteobacteria bacterium]|nr:MAG: hypothetical protein DRH37_08665 [Deltaproteobacteria bacterium]
MTNTNNTSVTGETETEAVVINLRGKYARNTAMNVARAVLGIGSTIVQSGGAGITWGTEQGLKIMPGKSGQHIAYNATVGGFNGWKLSFVSDKPVDEVIDSVLYVKEIFKGNDSYAKWIKGLENNDRADVTLAIEAGVTVEELEKSLETDPTGDLATDIINDKLDSMD